MPVLLLARGDKDARELLKKAIEARYGVRPPVIETLRITFAGRVQTRVGPITTWVPLELEAHFRLPSAMRWDFTAKPAGVPVRKGIESYDGMTFRTMRGNSVSTVNDDAKLVSTAQKRLWAIAAVLLTPLGDHFVELSLVDDLTFSARNTQIDTAVQIQLKPNYQIESVWVDMYNADADEAQRFSMRVDPELATFDDLLIPRKMFAFWGDKPWFEAEPTAVENNPEIPETVFTLGSNGGAEQG